MVIHAKEVQNAKEIKSLDFGLAKPREANLTAGIIVVNQLISAVFHKDTIINGILLKIICNTMYFYLFLNPI